MKKSVLIICMSVLSLSAQAQQLSPEVRWAVEIGTNYGFHQDVVYKRANQFECKLDVISANDKTHPRPTLIYIHGGGWIFGSKEGATLWLLPYLAHGMNVVNVEYRLASVSLAPAAVEDCRCALRWVYQNAKDYGLDLNHLVLNGHSAGGHLSLITGMLTPAAGFDNECPGTEKLQVAAIVNFFGVTDAADLLAGPNQKTYAVRWFGSLRHRFELAKQLPPFEHSPDGESGWARHGTRLLILAENHSGIAGNR